jgi:hypothetical protein
MPQQKLYLSVVETHREGDKRASYIDVELSLPGKRVRTAQAKLAERLRLEKTSQDIVAKVVAFLNSEGYAAKERRVRD